MATSGYSNGSADRWPFRLICPLLVAVTCIEWLIFGQRQVLGLASSALTALMLGLALTKFMVVVAWLLGRVESTTLSQKLFLFMVVLSGGAAIAMLVLAGI